MTPETSRQTEMEHDLRARVVSLEHASERKETRLTALETWRVQRDIADARRDEQFTGIKEDLKSIKSNLSRIVWMIITAIVLAVMAFLVRGGFHVP